MCENLICISVSANWFIAALAEFFRSNMYHNMCSICVYSIFCVYYSYRDYYF